MDFLLCYEGINREVENLSLIKYELQSRGYSCEIMRFNGPQYYVYSQKKNRARVVATPWLRYDVDLYPFLALAQKPYRIVNLQWEQVYSKRGLESGLCSISGQSIKAYHLCWGENSRLRLLESGVDDGRLAITGAIQMDYNRAIFERYYKSRESISSEYNLDKDKPWILFVSSFAYTKYSDEDAKRTEKRFGSFYADYIKLHKESQKETLLWIKKYLDSHPCEFIYRPHPSEDPMASTDLKHLEDNYPNFHVIQDYSVKQWAKIVDKVNLWISTSNAEIAAMGVDYAIVRPLEIPDEFEVESMVNDEMLETYNEFERFNLEDKTEEGQAAEEKLKRLSHFYSFNNEVPAYVRVADELEKILLSKEKVNYIFSISQKIKYGIIVLKWKILGRIMLLAEKYPEKRVIEKSCFKEIIKHNLKILIEGHQKAKLIESDVFEYLNSNSNNS